MKNVLFLLLLMSQAVPPTQNGIITGLLRSESGMPLAAVRVAALPAPDSNGVLNNSTPTVVVTSDTAGRYRLENLPPGRYYVTAGLAEFPTYFPGVITRAGAQEITLAPAATQANIDFSVRTALGVKVRGKVVRPLDQQIALAMVRVSIGREYGPPLQAVTPGADGSFEFAGIPSGTFLLRAEAQASRVVLLPIDVKAADINGVELRFPRTIQTNLRITVEDGGPVPRLGFASSAAASMMGLGGLPSREGYLSLVLPEGEQYFTVLNLPTGYLLKAMTYGTTDLLKERLNLSGSDTKPILITLGTVQPPPWFRARGKVVGSATRVFATNGNYELQEPLNADGSFEFSKIMPGEYRIYPDSNASMAVVVNVAGRNVDDVEIIVRRRVTLSGKIVMQDGSPSPRVSLMFAGPNGNTVNAQPTFRPDGSFNATLDEGQYRVDVGIPANYVLKSLANGSTNLLTDMLRVVGDTPPDLVLTLAAAQSTVQKVAGHIIGYANQGLNATKVVLTESTLGRDIETSIGTDGTFSFDGVPRGKYAVTFKPSVIGATYARILVEDKDIAGVELMVPKLAILSGQIVVDGGGPVPSFPIQFSGPAGTFRVGGRDIQGNFTLTLPESDYRLELTGFNVAGRPSPSALPAAYSVKSITHGSAKIDQQIKILTGSTDKLVITLQVTAFKLGGRVLGMSNFPQNQFRTRPELLLNSEMASGLPNLSVNVAPDGSFIFEKVPAGVYTTRLLPDMPGVEPKTIRVSDRDVLGVELPVPRLVEVKGRVVLDPGLARPRIGIGLMGESGVTFSMMDMGIDGRFTIKIPEGKQRVSVTGIPAGVLLKSFTYGPVDASKESIQVSEAANTELIVAFGFSGTWHRIAGRVVGIDIIADPIWRHVQLRRYDYEVFDVLPAADGSFVFPAVPPGSYTVTVNVPRNMATSPTYTLQVEKDVANLELRLTPPVGR